MHTLFDTLAASWQRFTCRIRMQRRMRRELRELRQMSAHELRDIGFSHPTIAVAAAADLGLRGC
jgi:uncharacterized protein YjiS (DUF1127 family)